MHKSQSTDCKRILDRSFQEEIDIREVTGKVFWKVLAIIFYIHIIIK